MVSSPPRVECLIESAASLTSAGVSGLQYNADLKKDESLSDDEGLVK